MIDVKKLKVGDQIGIDYPAFPEDVQIRTISEITPNGDILLGGSWKISAYEIGEMDRAPIYRQAVEVDAAFREKVRRRELVESIEHAADGWYDLPTATLQAVLATLEARALASGVVAK
jgi:hypothetical protein